MICFWHKTNLWQQQQLLTGPLQQPQAGEEQQAGDSAASFFITLSAQLIEASTNCSKESWFALLSLPLSPSPSLFKMYIKIIN